MRYLQLLAVTGWAEPGPGLDVVGPCKESYRSPQPVRPLSPVVDPAPAYLPEPPNNLDPTRKLPTRVEKLCLIAVELGSISLVVCGLIRYICDSLAIVF